MKTYKVITGLLAFIFCGALLHGMYLFKDEKRDKSINWALIHENPVYQLNGSTFFPSRFYPLYPKELALERKERALERTEVKQEDFDTPAQVVEKGNKFNRDFRDLQSDNFNTSVDEYDEETIAMEEREFPQQTESAKTFTDTLKNTYNEAANLTQDVWNNPKYQYYFTVELENTTERLDAIQYPHSQPYDSYTFLGYSDEQSKLVVYLHNSKTGEKQEVSRYYLSEGDFEMQTVEMPVYSKGEERIIVFDVMLVIEKKPLNVLVDKSGHIYNSYKPVPVWVVRLVPSVSLVK